MTIANAYPLSWLKERWIFYSQKGGSGSNKRNGKAKWAVLLGWCFPRKYRDAIVGDILEDSYEMRESGLAESKIRAHVLWQCMISVVTLVPSSIVHAIRRLLRTP